MGTIYSYFRKLQTKALIIGLDAAGKTTFLYRLKLGEVVTTIPTIGFNVEVLKYKNVELTAWDVGGRDKIRPLIRHYFNNTNVLIYIFDSNDDERLQLAKDEFYGYMNDNDLENVDVIVVANKWDLTQENYKQRDLQYFYNFFDLKTCSRPVYMFKAVATTGDGLNDILQYIVDRLERRDRTIITQSFTDEKVSVEPLPATATIKSNKFDAQKIWHFVKSILFECEDKLTY